MSRELQPRGFQQSPYERPEQNWVCGWTSAGGACPRGPSPDGRCDVTHECAPVLDRERWVCTRPPAYGGTCDTGPLPDGTCCRAVSRCQPERTLRAKRGRLTRWALAVAVAGLILGASGSMGPGFLSPGPVTFDHAPYESDCETCHAAGAGGPAEWFSAGLTDAVESPVESPENSELAHTSQVADTAETPPTSDSDRCRQCHDFSRQPHSVEPEDLASLTEIAQANPTSGGGAMLTLAGFGPGPATNESGELACATCHQEHVGRDAVLTRLGNRQCQVCHTNKFSSFGNGHPAFSTYPYARRTRIRFNHATHRTDHFPQEGTDFACLGCHSPDRQGKVMLVEGFDANCASCHENDVAVREGIAFIELPGINTEELSEFGIQIGEWPTYADVDLTNPFSPYLRVMLAANRENARSFGALPGGVDDMIFADLGADEEEAAAIGQLAWSIKELLYRLATEKQSALKEHLDSGLRRTMSENELAKLSGNFDFDLVSSAVNAWFPKLGSEIAAQRRHMERSGTQGYDLRSHRTQLVDSEGLETVEPIWGWTVDFEGFAIRYRPRGHADPLMQSWLEAAVHPDTHTDEGAMQFAFEALSTAEADGKCAKCHSVDITQNARVVNWQQKHRDRRKRGFTEYVHGPHLIQPELSDCTACHSMGGEAMAVDAAATPHPSGDDTDDAVAADSDDTVADDSATAIAPPASPPEPRRDSAKAYKTGFADGNHDPLVFESNFAPIDQATCASCHQSTVASDSCLNCHTYHVDPAGLHEIRANTDATPDTTPDTAHSTTTDTAIN
jgi:hypothetical protein